MKNIEEIFNKAYKSHKENNFSSAEKLYNKILTINSNHFETNFLLGSMLGSQKKYTEAKKFLNKAKQIKPKSDQVYNNLGMIFKELGEFEDAIKSFKKAIQLNSNYIHAYNNLTNTYEVYSQKLFKLNRHAEAIKYVQKGPGLITFTQKNFSIK